MLAGLAIAALGTVVAILSTRHRDEPVSAPTTVATSASQPTTTAPPPPPPTTTTAPPPPPPPTTTTAPPPPPPTTTTAPPPPPPPTTTTTAPPPPPPPRKKPKPGPAGWPDGVDGYAVVLESVPATPAGLAAARAAAGRARAAGLPRVGVLVSSAFSSLRPGFYAVVSGVYRTPAEAESAAGKARAAFPTAYPRHIAVGRKEN